eukprot:scaffold145502_cov78-Attheya_sp.AAC.1
MDTSVCFNSLEHPFLSQSRNTTVHRNSSISHQTHTGGAVVLLPPEPWQSPHGWMPRTLWQRDEGDGDGGDHGNNDECMLSVSTEGGSSECDNDSSGINYWL